MTNDKNIVNQRPTKAATVVLWMLLLTIITTSSYGFVVPSKNRFRSSPSFLAGVPLHQTLLQHRRPYSHSTRRQLSVDPVDSSSTSSSSSSNTAPTLVHSHTTAATASLEQQKLQLEKAVDELKHVLWEEYTSMFNPMRREFYANDVTFDDPLNSLSGVDAYQQNVDLLGSRTWLGAILFDNANIVLHSVEGGNVILPQQSQEPHSSEDNDGSTSVAISEITTRWTLSMTFQALPWKPTARFTGISVYQVEPVLSKLNSSSSSSSSKSSAPLVRILRQQDYWDSINLQQGGTYQKVSPQLGLQDLLQQLFTIPTTTNNALSSSTTFHLLRRAKTYQIRRYPSFTAIAVTRKDDDAGVNNALDTVMEALRKAGLQTLLQGPIIHNIPKGTKDETARSWWLLPLTALPSYDALSQQLPGVDHQIVTIPSRVVAVAKCPDQNSVEQISQQLRKTLLYDGIQMDRNVDAAANDSGGVGMVDGELMQWVKTNKEDSEGEVWLTLPHGSHPWSN